MAAPPKTAGPPELVPSMAAPPKTASLPEDSDATASYGRSLTGFADLRGPTWIYPSRGTHRPSAQSYYRRLPNQEVAMSAVLSPKPAVVRRSLPPDTFEAFRRYRCYPHKSDERFDAFLARAGLRLPAPVRSSLHEGAARLGTPPHPMDDPAPFEALLPLAGLFTAECNSVGGDPGENARCHELLGARFPELRAIFFAYARHREIQPLERVVRGERVWAVNRLEFLMLLRDCRLLDAGRNSAAAADGLFCAAARALRGVDARAAEGAPGPPAPDGRVALTLPSSSSPSSASPSSGGPAPPRPAALSRGAASRWGRFGDQRLLSMSERLERLLRDWVAPRAKRDRVRELRRAIAREPCHGLLRRAGPFLSAVFSGYRGADAFTRERPDERMSLREFARVLVDGALLGPLPRLGPKESLDLFHTCLCNTAQETGRLGPIDDDRPLMGLGEFTEALCRIAELRRSRAFDSFEEEPLDTLVARLLAELHGTLSRGVPGLQGLPRPPEPPQAISLTLPSLPAAASGGPRATPPASASGVKPAATPNPAPGPAPPAPHGGGRSGGGGGGGAGGVAKGGGPRERRAPQNHVTAPGPAALP
eukprot:tig00001373_g8447.t1